MKCPDCGARTAVRDSRPKKDGSVWRSRVCENGHRFRTSEVSELSLLELAARRRGRDELAAEIAAVLAEKEEQELAHAS